MQFMELTIRDSERKHRKSLDARMSEVSQRNLSGMKLLNAITTSEGREYWGGEKGWSVYDERTPKPVLLRSAVNNFAGSKISRVRLNSSLPWSNLRVPLSYWKCFQKYLMALDSLI